MAFQTMIYAGGHFGNAAMFGIPTGIKTNSNSDEVIVSDSSSNYYWGGDRTDTSFGKVGTNFESLKDLSLYKA